jgi:hypothetical protein
MGLSLINFTKINSEFDILSLTWGKLTCVYYYIDKSIKFRINILYIQWCIFNLALGGEGALTKIIVIFFFRCTDK